MVSGPPANAVNLVAFQGSSSSGVPPLVSVEIGVAVLVVARIATVLVLRSRRKRPPG
ncbi:MAG: hypothetical protein WA688_09205 [Thermoplasmata archaeon]